MLSICNLRCTIVLCKFNDLRAFFNFYRLTFWWVFFDAIKSNGKARVSTLRIDRLIIITRASRTVLKKWRYMTNFIAQLNLRSAVFLNSLQNTQKTSHHTTHVSHYTSPNILCKIACCFFMNSYLAFSILICMGDL